ncbi:hypothetical protein MXD81_13530, partial [Microbacteriaceae bacterium K1510]|nr:hypothetical protein [Microbacteriaceae bacterium K1510]
MPLLKGPWIATLAFACFASSFSIRIVDPLVPMLGRDFDLTLGSAAYLPLVFALPYALFQIPA